MSISFSLKRPFYWGYGTEILQVDYHLYRPFASVKQGIQH